MLNVRPAETLKEMGGEGKCEPTEDTEAKGEKAMIKVKFQNSLIFKGKGRTSSNV